MARPQPSGYSELSQLPGGPVSSVIFFSQPVTPHLSLSFGLTGARLGSCNFVYLRGWLWLAWSSSSGGSYENQKHASVSALRCPLSWSARSSPPLPQPRRGAVLMPLRFSNAAPLHSRCLRCHRPLKDHISQARGYGPECWRYVRYALPPSGVTLSEKRSISNIFTVNEVFADIEKRIYSHTCPSCGTHLTGSTVTSYDHSDGLNLRGFLAPQWVYVSCKVCGLDTSLHRLTRDTCRNLCKHPQQRTLTEAFSY